MEIWREAERYKKATQSLWEKFREAKGEERKEEEAFEEVKEEKKGESKSHAARKKTSNLNLHSDCWAPSMCCEDNVKGRNASTLMALWFWFGVLK